MKKCRMCECQFVEKEPKEIHCKRCDGLHHTQTKYQWQVIKGRPNLDVQEGNSEEYF